MQEIFPVIARRPRVLELTGLSSSGLDREIDRGYFPPPIRLSPDCRTRAVGWLVPEIAEVNRAKAAGADIEDLKTLVADLVAARTRACAREAA